MSHARALTLLALLTGCARETGSPTKATSAEPGDAALPDSGVPPTDATTTATVDAGGGSLALADGTTLVIPPGAVREPVEVTLREVASVAAADLGVAGEDGGPELEVAGPAFVIDPAFTSIVPLELRVPLAALPGAPETLRLAASAEGVVDGRPDDGTATLDRVHLLSGPTSVDDTHATFTTAGTDGTTWQAFARRTSPSAGRSTPAPPGWFSDDCSDHLEDWFGETPPADLGLADWEDVDDLVELSEDADAALENLRLSWEVAGADTAPLDEALLSLRARVCLAAWRTAQRAAWSDTDPHTMQLPWPLDDWDAPEDGPATLHISLQWQYSGCPATPAFATANGDGLNIFLAPACEAPQHPYGVTKADWNRVAGGADAGHADRIEATVAHELFHHLDAWADLDKGSEFGLEHGGVAPVHDSAAFTEGAADAFMERIYDDVPGFAFQPLAIWQRAGCTPASTPMWAESYRTNAFWRFLDHTQDTPTATGSVYAELLRYKGDQVRGEDCPGTGCGDRRYSLDDLDAVVADLYPSRTDMDLGQAFADFATDYLLLHAAEGGVLDAPTDHFPDVLGELTPETDPGDLWNTVPNGCGTTSQAAGVPTVPPDATLTAASLPATQSLTVDAWKAGIIELDLTSLRGAPSPTVRLTLEDGAGSPVADTVHARVVGTDAGGPEVLGRIDGGARQSVVISTEAVDSQQLYVVLANTDRTAASATIEVHLEEVTQVAFALSSYGIVGLDVDAPGTVAICDDSSAELPLAAGYRGDAAQLDGLVSGLAVAYPFVDEVRVYDPTTCTDTGPLSVSTPSAHALGTTATGDLLVIAGGDYTDPCTGGTISVYDPYFDLILNTVSVPIGIYDLAMARAGGVDYAVAAPAGDSACPGAHLQIVDVQALAAASTPAEVGASLSSVAAGGPPTGRIAASTSGRFVAWTVDTDPGIVGLRDLDSGTQWTGSPDRDGDGMQLVSDVDVVDHGDGSARVYFLVERLYDPDNYDPSRCDGSGVTCGALRWFDHTVGAATEPLAGQWQLSQPLPSRLGVFASGFAVVGHTGHDAFTVVDLGSHTGGVSGTSTMSGIDNPLVIEGR